ncbi:MAG: type II secretion system F family protein, partial [Candidatus Hydrogenedentes bacterium]|nr:type II secretion system F family protein [Candidatus Hydrogenedentota bacterium]
QNSSVIPPVLTDMPVTGEESGRVDQVCEQIADVFEEEVKISVNTLGETLQPVFTVIIGFVVIFLFISLFMPLVTMIQEISSAGV